MVFTYIPSELIFNCCQKALQTIFFPSNLTRCTSNSDLLQSGIVASFDHTTVYHYMEGILSVYEAVNIMYCTRVNCDDISLTSAVTKQAKLQDILLQRAYHVTLPIHNYCSEHFIIISVLRSAS